MQVSELGEDALRKHLSQSGLYLRTGEVVFHIRSNVPVVATGIQRLYSHHECALEAEFADFHINLRRPLSLRRWYQPYVFFELDGHVPFDPLPASQAYALLEWGMNWCLANHLHQYLKIHAAVLAKDGKAIIMPGEPGAGKSTLSAALMCDGWQLVSDELAMLEPETGELLPLNRPISLKNNSIELISALNDGLVFGPVSDDTHKGTVVHLQGNYNSAKPTESVLPAWLVFPQYTPGAEPDLRSYSKALSFVEAAESAFNYSLLGKQGFFILRDMIERMDCYAYKYSTLDKAVAHLNTHLV